MAGDQNKRTRLSERGQHFQVLRLARRSRPVGSENTIRDSQSPAGIRQWQPGSHDQWRSSWLCFPVIEQDGKSLVSRTDLAKTIEPLVRPHRVPDVGKVQTVVLDPGHGGHDKGQVSRYGAEKDFALDVARKLRPILQAKGFRVIMTREGDYFVPLEVRAKIANSARNSIFVSIHFNATNDDPNATGFEIFSFTPRGAPSTSDGNVTTNSFNMQPGSSVDAQSHGALRVHLSFASRPAP